VRILFLFFCNVFHGDDNRANSALSAMVSRVVTLYLPPRFATVSSGNPGLFRLRLRVRVRVRVLFSTVAVAGVVPTDCAHSILPGADRSLRRERHKNTA